MLTVLITLAMILSALAVISMAAQPAYATSSGTVTYNPTTLGLTVVTTSPLTYSPIQTVAFVSGGTFSSGATIFFYLSTTDSSTGLVATGGSSHYYAIGYTTLTAASPTTLDQAVTFFSGGNVFSAPGTSTPAVGITPGVYYILASDQVPTSITAPSVLTSYAFPAASTQFVVQTATLKIENPLDSNAAATGPDALLVGGTGIAYGTGFDSGASVSVTLSYPGGTVLVTATANSAGIFEASFTVPQLAGTVDPSGALLGTGASSIAYTAVAQETNAYSSAFPQGGITADSTFDVGPVLTVSPVDYSGAAGSTLTLTGTGFPGGAVMSASSQTSPSISIQIMSFGSTTNQASNTYHSAVTVSSTGQFTVTVTTVSAIPAPTTSTEPYGGPYSIYIQMTDTLPYETQINELFTPAVYVSVPNPQLPGFYFEPAEVSGGYYPVVSSLTAAAYDFPASATVSIYLGSTLVGNVTTDANGFGQLPVTATLPAIPAGSYTATAIDNSLHLVATATTGYIGAIKVDSFFKATDPVGNPLYTTAGNLANVEYVPQNGTIIVSAYGLAPGTPYTAEDSVIHNIAVDGTNVTVTVGSIYYTGKAFVPAANGTLIFTYQPFYGYYLNTTGTPELITLRDRKSVV